MTIPNDVAHGIYLSLNHHDAGSPAPCDGYNYKGEV